MLFMISRRLVVGFLPVLVFIGSCGCGIREGSSYVRTALPVSDIDQRLGNSKAFSDSADHNLTRFLAAEMLRSDLHVLIDRIGRCDAITYWYASLNREIALLDDPLEQQFRSLRPVHLFGEGDGRCYSYTIEHTVPLPEPSVWRRRLLTSIPVRISIIHAMRDARFLLPRP